MRDLLVGMVFKFQNSDKNIQKALAYRVRREQSLLISILSCRTIQTLVHTIRVTGEFGVVAMTGKDNIIPKCFICGEVPMGGIRDGLYIGRKFICSSCENKIVSTNTSDAEYSFFSDKLKEVWV